MKVNVVKNEAEINLTENESIILREFLGNLSARKCNQIMEDSGSYITGRDVDSLIFALWNELGSKVVVGEQDESN